MNIKNKVNGEDRKEVIIDCDANPKIPKRSKIVRHRKYGEIIWDPKRIKLLEFDPDAKPRSYYKGISVIDEMRAAFSDDPRLSSPNILRARMWKDGRELLDNVYRRAEAEGGSPLNVNVLDYLLEHQESVQEDWRGKEIVFAGTEYSGTSCDVRNRSELYARTLLTNGRHVIQDWLREEGKGKLIYKIMFYSSYPVYLTYGFSNFYEGTFAFDDMLRFLTCTYVPIYIWRPENKTPDANFTA